MKAISAVFPHQPMIDSRYNFALPPRKPLSNPDILCHIVLTPGSPYSLPTLVAYWRGIEVTGEDN